jgi:hypothetical protein
MGFAKKVKNNKWRNKWKKKKIAYLVKAAE